MPAATLNLTGENIIEANSYWSLDVFYPGNIAAGRIRGQIRKPATKELVTNFRFEPPVYESAGDRTRFKVYLTSFDTEKLPQPPSGQMWVYDILIQPPSMDYKRVVQGTVSISPGVTDV